jgi:hypothetical protein
VEVSAGRPPDSRLRQQLQKVRIQNGRNFRRLHIVENDKELIKREAFPIIERKVLNGFRGYMCLAERLSPLN